MLKRKGLTGVMSCLALPALGSQLVEAGVGTELLFGVAVTITTTHVTGATLGRVWQWVVRFWVLTKPPSPVNHEAVMPAVVPTMSNYLSTNMHCLRFLIATAPLLLQVVLYTQKTNIFLIKTKLVES